MLRLFKTNIGQILFKNTAFIRIKKSPKIDIKQKAFTQATEELMEDIFDQYKNKVDKNTVLKDFRKQIFNREQVNDSYRMMELQYNKKQRQLQKILNQDIDHPTKVVKFSKKLMQRLTNNQKIIHNKDIFKDQTDYTAYQSNYTQLQDRKLGQMQSLDNANSIKRGYSFINSLPDNYRQKNDLNNQFLNLGIKQRSSMTIADFGQIQQKKQIQLTKTNEYRSTLSKLDRGSKVSSTLEGVQQPINDMNNMINENYQVNDPYSLSPQAVTKIYQLYLLGWTVRDISRRFGILPRRTKFCIWCRAQLFNQVLPKTGMLCFINDLKYDRYLAENYGGYLDYGLDFAKMNNENLLFQIKVWQPNTVDAKRKPQQYTQALAKLQKNKKFDKYVMLNVGTHGKKGKMYKKKQWNVFRGKGSDHYHLRNDTFRQLSKAQKKMVYKYY